MEALELQHRIGAVVVTRVGKSLASGENHCQRPSNEDVLTEYEAVKKELVTSPFLVDNVVDSSFNAISLADTGCNVGMRRHHCCSGSKQ